MKSLIAIVAACALPLFGQSHSGELRLRVTDPAGLAVKTTVQITSAASRYRSVLATNDQGRLDLQRLPYGIYQIEIKQPGFAGITESVDIHSSLPT
ncbi:MAG: carboxypeptidase-like regulatory domain-containing protein, partial [Terriglobales bacterium]